MHTLKLTQVHVLRVTSLRPPAPPTVLLPPPPHNNTDSASGSGGGGGGGGGGEGAAHPQHFPTDPPVSMAGVAAGASDADGQQGAPVAMSDVLESCVVCALQSPLASECGLGLMCNCSADLGLAYTCTFL